MKPEELERLTKLIRYWILKMTTEAGSGHATSSLSAVELMVGLMFGGFFKHDIDNSKYENNDRLIFSKGHASPLFYSLWAAAKGSLMGQEELLNYRKFDSPLEGHPTMRFTYTEAATGSLGQGLSIGVGMALNAKLEGLSYRTYVLVGDSEMAEGSVWEAIQLAKHYKLDNLIAIVDVNRLGQRGETMYGHDVVAYKRRLKAFGWQTYTVDGHKLEHVLDVYKSALKVKGKPVMVIAKTIKGKGVSFLENKEGWHGRALSREQLEKALEELGKVDTTIRGMVVKPKTFLAERSDGGTKSKPNTESDTSKVSHFDSTTFRSVKSYRLSDVIATREAYGDALVKIGAQNPGVVVLDAEVSNSTFSEKFKAAYPKRFFEMFIAEQNMVGTAVGLARMGKIPFVSTFAAFFTRAFDQIRMAQYCQANIKFCGSHAGVSIGADGPSQMGLEDLAMFRSLRDGVILYPCDAVSTMKLVEEAIKHQGIVYLRTTRGRTPVVYGHSESFVIGGCKVLRESKEDVTTVVAAGITLHEALKAYEVLQKHNVKIRVIDLYSIKPLDIETLKKAAEETKAIITVEDHYPEGGIGEAVASALIGKIPTISLAVHKLPRSGKPEELLRYEAIDSLAIVNIVKTFSGQAT